MNTKKNVIKTESITWKRH